MALPPIGGTPSRLAIIVTTLRGMEIAFDPAKDARNRAKHGVSLALAAEFEWDTALMKTDDRRDYGEDRQIGIGYIGPRLFAMIFVERADGIRVISLRKATKPEAILYASA